MGLQRKAMGSAGAVSGCFPGKERRQFPSALFILSKVLRGLPHGEAIRLVRERISLIISRSRWANGRGRVYHGSVPKGLARNPEGSRSNYYRRYGKSRNSRRDKAQSHTDDMPRLARDSRWDRIHRLLSQTASLLVSILRPLRLSGPAKKCS